MCRNNRFKLLTAFGTDGFTLEVQVAVIQIHKHMYAAWKINGGTTSTNTSGTITSTVQANQDIGISIVNTQQQGTNGTVGHGLSLDPSRVCYKYER